jgi:hypothetical protein
MSVLICASAHADDNGPAPWSVSVTADQKAVAKQHLDAGNALFLQHKYAEALEEYRLATAAWDHPAIRFNMVRCQIFLDRPLEAADNLKLALRYGAAPFDETIYNEALGYEKLLGGEIGEVDINCGQPGVRLTMDGQQLISCPGREHRRVLPGQHQLVGTKEGFIPRTVDLVVLGGKHQHALMELDPLSKAARIAHRWPSWVPWSVFAGGFTLAGIGGLTQLKASSDNSAYASTITRDCANGCPTGTIDRSLERSAKLENGIAIGLISVGAIAVAAGSALLYLNRGHTVYDLGPEGSARHVRLDLVPTRDGAALSITGGF